MAMGRRGGGRQKVLFVAAAGIRAPGHPFYRALDGMLAEAGFDGLCEETCAAYYAERLGRPSVAPGVYFRMLVVGYLEGIGSERGIAWRCAESLSLREFLGYELDENPPDHSTVSRTRRRLPAEAHEAVFARVLELLEESGLLSGKTLGIDSTTLEGNAAMRSIVRRDTGEGYQLFLEGLAEASGIETPSRADLAKLDRKRPRKGSNEDWEHPHDPDARITKMKDGRTRMGHKLEHAVDMSSGAVCGLTVQPTTGGDCASLPKTLGEARGQLERVGAEVRELVCDKGYHSNATMKRLAGLGVRSYVSEPNRGRRSWKRDRAAQKPTYANRRRIRGARGKGLLRARGEKLERAFAHMLTTGGMRRTHLRGHENIRKRMLVHAAGFNLGLLMRHRYGYGTPRSLQGRRASTLQTGGLRVAFSALFRPKSRVFGHPGPVEARISLRRRPGRAGATVRRHFAEVIFRGPQRAFATAV
ncbi:transposase [Candidatus Palauibacter sp.]|uniref:transposase n=1 Tax=Candidatus Palauibacter sp. TaxID=3101350 RepID=UPI003B02693D